MSILRRMDVDFISVKEDLENMIFKREKIVEVDSENQTEENAESENSAKIETKSEDDALPENNPLSRFG